MSKTKKIIISVVAAIIVLLGAYVAYIFSTTYSYNQALNYCLKHTQIGATEFYFCSRDGYHYFLAEGNKDDRQELFRFEQEGMLAFNRYRTAGGDVGDDTTVGSFLYFSKDENGKNSSIKNYTFYSTSDKMINKCVYTISINGVDKEYTKGLSDKFVFTIIDIGIKDGLQRELEKITFYHDDTVVQEYFIPVE